MANKRKASTVRRYKAIRRDSIFGPAPILNGEDSTAYDEMLGQVSSAVKPSDVIEDIWVRDVANLTWEILRWGRVKTNILAAAVQHVLAVRLAPSETEEEETHWPVLDTDFGPEPPADEEELIELWAMSDPAAIECVEKLMVSRNVTMDAVIAQALMSEIDDIERIDGLITAVEARRNSVLREIDRRRLTFAQLLREKVQQIEDAEFKTVKPDAQSPKYLTNKNAA